MQIRCRTPVRTVRGAHRELVAAVQLGGDVRRVWVAQSLSRWNAQAGCAAAERRFFSVKATALSTREHQYAFTISPCRCSKAARAAS